MVRTQIQLPDGLYKRAKRLAEIRETTLAALVRRGLEILLQQYPETSSPDWELPNIDVGKILVPLESIHDIAAADMDPSIVVEDTER